MDVRSSVNISRHIIAHAQSAVNVPTIVWTCVARVHGGWTKKPGLMLDYTHLIAACWDQPLPSCLYLFIPPTSSSSKNYRIVLNKCSRLNAPQLLQMEYPLKWGKSVKNVQKWLKNLYTVPLDPLIPPECLSPYRECLFSTIHYQDGRIWNISTWNSQDTPYLVERKHLPK